MAVSEEIVKLAQTAMSLSLVPPTWRQRLIELEREMAKHAGRARRQEPVTASLDPAGHLRGEVVRLSLSLQRRCPEVEWPRVCDSNFDLLGRDRVTSRAARVLVLAAVKRQEWQGTFGRG